MTELTTTREIGIITAEIITIRENTNRMVLESSIEIGRRLLEAKEVVGHGGWGEYLREQVNFSPSTANNLMALCREYGDAQLELGKAPKSQTFGNLTYSQAVALLALPAEAREAVVAEHDMETTSVRELQAIIEEKKREAASARAAAEQAEASLAEAVAEKDRAKEAALKNSQLAHSRGAELEKREQELAAAREEIQRLENRTVEVAVQPPTEEELAALRQEAELAAAKKLREELAGLQKELTESRQAGEQQSARAAELEKRLEVAGDQGLVECNLLLRQLQETAERLHHRYLGILSGDREKAERLKKAIRKVVRLMAERWES